MNTNKEVLDRFEALYRGLLDHDGFGEIRLEVRILKRGQKEVLIHCGKQYRFVVDWRPKNPLDWAVRRERIDDEEAAPAEADAPAPRPERRRRQEPIDFPDRRRKPRSGGGA